VAISLVKPRRVASLRRKQSSRKGWCL